MKGSMAHQRLLDTSQFLIFRSILSGEILMDFLMLITGLDLERCEAKREKVINISNRKEEQHYTNK